MGIFSCKGCTPPKRYPGCHSTCPDYIRDKAEYDKRKEIASKQNRIDQGLTQQKFNAINKANKHKRKGGKGGSSNGE